MFFYFQKLSTTGGAAAGPSATASNVSGGGTPKNSCKVMRRFAGKSAATSASHKAVASVAHTSCAGNRQMSLEVIRHSHLPTTKATLLEDERPVAAHDDPIDGVV